METKANYFAIGAFTILGFLGILGFFAWFSKLELDRQYAYYDVYFANVSGLDRASTVKFAGLAVGQVVDLRLAESGDGSVRVRLEVDAATPVRIDSVATIEAQGVTGVSFVGISSGSSSSDLLARAASDGAPDIVAGKSALQTLTEDAPRVIDETLAAIEQINSFLSPENGAQLERILTNLGNASEELETTLTEFSNVAQDVGRSASEISSFTNELEGISTSVESTLSAAQEALIAIDTFATDATSTLKVGTDMLKSADRTVTLAGDMIENQFTTAIEDLTQTSGSLRQQVETLSANAGTLIDTWRATGTTLTDRLTQAETLLTDGTDMIAELRGTLATIDQVGQDLDTLVTTDATALITEARGALSRATDILTPIADAAETDIPAILDDIRSATAEIERVVTQTGADLTSASGDIAGLSETAQSTLAEITETFSRARMTLDTFDQTLAVTDGALGSAQSAFDSADQVLSTDIGPMMDELRATASRLTTALDQVSQDLPGITGDLQSAATRADGAAADLQQLIDSAQGPVASFAQNGLPQYTQLASEARQLVQVMETLVDRLERNPARFITGGSTPEYRR